MPVAAYRLGQVGGANDGRNVRSVGSRRSVRLDRRPGPLEAFPRGLIDRRRVREESLVELERVGLVDSPEVAPVRRHNLRILAGKTGRQTGAWDVYRLQDPHNSGFDDVRHQGRAANAGEAQPPARL